jgi:hypothetical protein
MITAGGISSNGEMGFYLLQRAGYDEHLLAERAPVMEYSRAYTVCRHDVERVEQML